jgi:signal transduction histidine kinase
MRRMRTWERARWNTHRPLLPALLLSVLIGASAGFAASARPAARDSTRVLLAASRFERLVADMEAGQLRYIATGDRGMLTPWHAARAAFPQQAAQLQRLAEENSPEQGRRAREIVRAVTSYLHEHAEPLVRKAQHDHRSARSVISRAEGKRRIDAIRRQVDRFTEVQHRLAVSHERDAVPALRRMIALVMGTSGSLLLVFLLVGYVQRARGRMTARGGGPGAEDQERRALRRLAARLAEDAAPAEAFSLAAREMGRALGAEYALVCRYERDGTVTVAGHWSADGATAPMPPAGGRWPVEDETVTDVVHRTGRPAHLRADLPAVGPIGAWIRSNGIQRMTGCPIVAGDRLWGMAAVLSRDRGPEPAGSTRAMEEFAALLGVVAVNARRRAELAASRVRLVEAADAVRHRVEQALHTRTQQRLVTAGLGLRTVEAAIPPDLSPLRDQVSAAADTVGAVIDDLREVARDLHPAYLDRRGLGASLRALGGHAGVPVEFDVDDERRLPDIVATTVYFVVSEALANVARHAHASLVRVVLDSRDPLRLSVHDDGAGGARIRPGAALAGLKERVEALAGSFELDSPVGAGTTVRVTLPVAGLPAAA